MTTNTKLSKSLSGIFTICLLLITSLFISCGGSSGGGGDNGVSSDTAEGIKISGENIVLSIEPSAVIIAPGQAQDFIASVTGTDNEAVTWSASAGVIDDSGNEIIFTAPDTTGVFDITVTSAADSSKKVTATITVTDKGVLLEGDPDVTAKAACTDLHINLKINSNEISVDGGSASGGEILRTELLIEFSDSATVAEVNTLLTDINGGIVGMYEGVPIMIIRIPDPGTVNALNQIISDIETRSYIDSVTKSLIVEEDILPADLSDSDRLDHNLAVRAHAAWNIRDMIPGLNDRPWLVIGDLFGNGKPNIDFNTLTKHSDFGQNHPTRHGYHVLGIIAGSFGKKGNSQDRGDVTGVFPDKLRVRAVDRWQGSNTSLPHMAKSILKRIRWIVKKDLDANIVINTSLNSRKYSTQQQNIYARTWTKLIRHFGLEDRVLHITSAGNVAGNVTWDARDNSIFSYAALGNMTDAHGAVVSNLSNIIVVENRVNTAATDSARPRPGCVANHSIMGGTLSAIGTSVWSFTATAAASLTGTSMATPQVAGLAAYVWALNADADSQDIIDLLNNTARSAGTSTPGVSCNPAAVHQDVIDAYDAVMAAGGTQARHALMDVAGTGSLSGPDGSFDEYDVEHFLFMFDLSD